MNGSTSRIAPAAGAAVRLEDVITTGGDLTP